MSPGRITSEAVMKGIDVIGITDHNSAENVAAVRGAAGAGLTVLAGLEITSREEVHLLALFDDIESALSLQDFVYDHLPAHNDEEIFGATTLPFEEIVDRIHRVRGLAIPAHVDREAFGIIGQLGFVPPDVDLDGLETSKAATREDGLREFSQEGRYPIIRSSDAHQPEEIGSATTTFLLEMPQCDEIGMGLRNEAGRRIMA